MRYFPLLLMALVLVLIVACNQPQLIDNTNETGAWIFPNDDDSVRPDFNRTYDPDDWPDDDLDDDDIINPPNPNQSVFVTRHERSTSFRIPFMTAFGDGYPVLDRDDVQLLKPAPLLTGDQHFRGYDQFLRFAFDENSTGNVSFMLDESRDPEYLGTAMFFSDELPILEYVLDLRGQPFFSDNIIGSHIMLLGSSFQVQEATNESLQLNGLDIEQYLSIRNGKELESNRKRMANTEIDYDGFGFAYRIFAQDIDEDGLLLREGETLRQRFIDENREELLPGDFFDIRYDGLEVLDSEKKITFTIDNHEDWVELEWESAWNEVKVPILGYREDGVLIHGNTEHKLHLRECENSRDGCIKLEDTVVLAGRVPDKYGRPGAPISVVMRFTGIDPDEGRIIFRDPDGNRISTDWEGDPGSSRHPAIAVLPFLDREYRIWVHNSTGTLPNGSLVNVTDRIAMDLDGYGGVSGNEVDLLVIDGVQIRFDGLLESNLQASSDEIYTLNITIETMPFKRAQSRDRRGNINKEMLFLQLVAEDGVITTHIPTRPANAFAPAVPIALSDDFLSDQILYENPLTEEDAYGMTPWGSILMLDYDDSEDTQSTTKDVTIEFPVEQRFALVTIGNLIGQAE